MKKIVLLGFLLVGAIAMIVMSYHYFQFDDIGILKKKDVADRAWYLFALRTHIMLGIVAISVGPFQFINRIRTKFSIWHRRIGYVYMASVFISSISGLVVAPFAMGGAISSIGFSVLAVIWFTITYLGLHKILREQVRGHQKMMYFSYALTFAAITQRTMLLTPIFLEVEFMNVYRLSAWLPWICNLLIAIYLTGKLKERF